MARGRKSVRSVALFAALPLMVGCEPLDDEADLRGTIAGWLALDETLFFSSMRDCTAAVFRVKSGALNSSVRVANSVEEGLFLSQQGHVTAFDISGTSPSEISRQVITASSQTGTDIMSNGLSARDCMSASVESDYFIALNTPDAVLIFDPERQTLGVLEAKLRILYIARGTI